jgi:hypothetical protein
MILTALISDIFVMLKGPDSGLKLEELINTNISAINDAEDKAEKDHFLTE